MAATETPTVPNGGFVTLSGIDADWIWTDYFTGNSAPVISEKGMIINSVKFVPGAANDVLVLKDQANTGAEICELISSTGETKIDSNFGDFHHKPYLDFADSTISNGALVIINYSLN